MKRGRTTKRRLRREGWLVLALPFLASCATAPPVEHPPPDFEVPPAWTAPASIIEERHEDEDAAGADAGAVEVAGAPGWWSGFGDPLLDELVAEAALHNHDLRAAAARIGAALSQARIAGADALPRATAEADASRSRRNFIGFPIPGSSSDVLTTRSTIYGLSLNVIWEVDLWGRVRAARSATLADLGAAVADLEAARLSVMGQTAKVWFSLVEARRQLELALATLENFRSTHERITSRYERGLRPSLDVRLSRANILSAESEAARRKADLDRLLRQLEVLVGRYPAAELEVSPELPRLAAAVPASLPGELVSRRPDIVRAERRLAAAGARVKEARRALFPRISLSASGGTQSSDVADLADLDFGIWSIGANLAQPIFQGGRLVAGIDLAESRQREALASYLRTALDAFLEVEAALAAAAFLEEEEAALAEAVEEALAARELAEDRYARGLDDIITVLEAQRRAFDAEKSLLAARRRRLENRVDLHLALGGGYRDPAALAEEERRKKEEEEGEARGSEGAGSGGRGSGALPGGEEALSRANGPPAPHEEHVRDE